MTQVCLPVLRSERISERNIFSVSLILFLFLCQFEN